MSTTLFCFKGIFVKWWMLASYLYRDMQIKMSFKSIVEWVTIHSDLKISIETIASGKYTSSYMISLIIDHDVVQEFIFHNQMKKNIYQNILCCLDLFYYIMYWILSLNIVKMKFISLHVTLSVLFLYWDRLDQLTHTQMLN